MKKLLALALVALMAGAAFAQPGIGVFFSATDFVDANTNMDTAGAPFNAYVVIIDSPVSSIGAYEVGITISDPAVFVLSVTGPNGWTNFGSNTNHLCGFTTPVPVTEGAAVMATMNMLQSVATEATISMGPATPASIPDVPAIADGADPDVLIACVLDSGDSAPVVATLNGDGIVAAEAHSLSSVKALFN